MKLIDLILSPFRSHSVKPGVKRMYKAAQAGRLTNGWRAATERINMAVRSGLNAIRGYARELAQNNDWVKGYLLRSVANIIGPEGFLLQVKAITKMGKPDDKSSKIIEAGWSEWTKATFCTMAGTLSFVRVQWLWAKQFRRDGELLIRKVENPNVNKFGFSLELLEPDVLDETYNVVLSNGNTVIMGVEINNWKRPVAYWIKENDNQSELYGYQKTQLQRVPAEEIILLIDPEHPNQLRAVSPLAQCMKTLHNLEGFDDAALIRNRAGAEMVGFIIQKHDGSQPYEGDDTDTDGNIIKDFSPGTIEELPYGKEFQGWDPKYPAEMYQSYTKGILRRIATSLGISYNSFTNDLESVNYSSLRAGKGDEIDAWMILQKTFIEGLLIPIYESWLKMSLLCYFNNLDYAQYDNYNRPTFQGRGWPYINPVDEVNSAVTAIQQGLDTRTNVLRRQGKDFEEVVATLAKEQEIIKKYNVTLGENNVSTNTGTDQADNSTPGDAPVDGGQGNNKTGREYGRIISLQ